MTALRHTLRETHWGDTPESPRVRGLRIERGRGFTFIPDAELFDLAHAIADYLDAHTEAGSDE